jgi:cystathionine beta-synthase
MSVYESVTDAIGDTPLFRLRRLAEGIAAPVYAKVEHYNVGGSVKDRAALSMVERAERDGSLRPGGVIIEGTSGNTGIGLALVGRSRGYRVLVGVPEKIQPEKIDILKAYGAEVIKARTDVAREDPAHLFNVVRRLEEEIPGGWLANQYDNPANPDAHVRTTGPEIWHQTRGRVTHFVAGVGTGGTISGTGQFLKQVSGNTVQVIGADPETSAYNGQGDGSPYYVESIGHFVHPDTREDVWPESYHPGVVDRFEIIGDRESLLTARRLSREEGILAGASSGTAVAGALRVARELGPDGLVVTLLPDSGRSYLSKVHSDAWLRTWGFLDEPFEPSILTGEAGEPTVLSVIGRDRAGTDVVTVESDATLGEALSGEALSGEALSAGFDTARHPEVPVALARRDRRSPVNAAEILGALDLDWAARAVAEGLDPDSPVRDHLAPALPAVGIGQSVPSALDAMGERKAAVLLVDGRAAGLLTRDDLLKTL